MLSPLIKQSMKNDCVFTYISIRKITQDNQYIGMEVLWS